MSGVRGFTILGGGSLIRGNGEGNEHVGLTFAFSMKWT